MFSAYQPVRLSTVGQQSRNGQSCYLSTAMSINTEGVEEGVANDGVWLRDVAKYNLP